jgi:hypothetical protein
MAREGGIFGVFSNTNGYGISNYRIGTNVK